MHACPRPCPPLDPQGTREVCGLIREIATGGITVLVSSHLLAEVEQICSHVGVMRTGRLVFEGTLDELRARAYLDLLRDACDRLDVSPLPPGDVVPQAEIYRVEAGLRRSGLDVRETASR